MSRRTAAAAKDAPLSNVQAERALLGALFRSPHDFWQVADVVRSDQFTTPLHREIFAALSDLMNEGGQFSMTTLASRLPEADEGGVNIMGALATLAHNADGVSAEDFVSPIVETAARRSAIRVAEDLLAAAKAMDMPIEDAITATASRIAEIGNDVNETATVSLDKILDKVMDLAAQAYQDQGQSVAGISTGLRSLDEILGPLRPGRLYFLGGQEKSGKTALASQIMEKAAEQGPVFMAQGEMTDIESGQRSLAGASRISASKIETGDFNPAEWDAMQEARRKLPGDRVFYWFFRRARISHLRHRFVTEHRRRGIKLGIVDHLLEVEADKEYENEFRGIAKVVRGLKNIAMDLKIPLICMTHRTRSSQDRPDPTPYATDFFGGSVIERACDALFCVYSKYRWMSLRKPDANRGQEAFDRWTRQLDQERDKTQIALLVHRHAAFPKIIDVRYNGPLTRFEELIA